MAASILRKQFDQRHMLFFRPKGWLCTIRNINIRYNFEGFIIKEERCI